MPYIRLGAEWSRDKLDYTQALVGTTTVIGANGRRNSYRAIAGLGLEVPVQTFYGINGLTVRAEYDYHGKGKTVDGRSSSFVPGLSSVFLDASRNPNSQSGILSIVWNI